MTDLFADYALGLSWDEMFAAPGEPRLVARELHATLRSLSTKEFADRCAERDRSFRDRGVTFDLGGEERPFPLDPVPRIVAAEEWAVVERGVAQRVRALEAFLADVYGAGEILADGVVPRRLVVTSAHFLRPAAGVVPPNGVRIHVAGIDLVRDVNGSFCVLEDNVRIPSGVSYVLENRRTMARIFPELFASHRVRPVADYPEHLLRALEAAAPPRRLGRSHTVVLTPGVHNSAYFEHSFLARQMGVELVEGRDLVCRDGAVFMRTTSGDERVDVIYRRVDDEFLDPVHFRDDSLLGCPGLLNAARAGTVTIANAVGNGVADDKLTYTYVPALIDYYLGERPILPNVTTHRLEDRDVLADVLGRLDQLVLKPVDGSGGYGLVIGSQSSDEELARIAAEITAAPRSWIAQETVALSTSPTKIGDLLEPRHVDLRPFAVNDGEGIWVVPGGLTRVALPAGSLVVNSSQGGGSKDTWVLADAGDRPATSNSANGVRPLIPGVDGLFSSGPQSGPGASGEDRQQQQQQQQDGGRRC